MLNSVASTQQSVAVQQDRSKDLRLQQSIYGFLAKIFFPQPYFWTLPGLSPCGVERRKTAHAAKFRVCRASATSVAPDGSRTAFAGSANPADFNASGAFATAIS
jgi:hypothetical protein